MRQQQTGIAALPQQQPPQMPGQAPGIQQAVPQMQPKGNTASGVIPNFVAPLAQRGMPQLLQEFNNPQSQFPKFAVLTAMKKRQEADRLRRDIQGQAALAQTQQQQGSVKDEILAQVQQPVMAAQGGMMQGYANGGAVAFQSGGSPEIESILKKHPSERTPEENEILRAAGISLVRRQAAPEDSSISALNKALESPFMRRAFTGEAYTLPPEKLSKRTDAGALTEKMFRGLGGEQYVEPPRTPPRTPPFAPEAIELMKRQGPRTGGVPAAPTTFDVSPDALPKLRVAAQDPTISEGERTDLQRRIAMMEAQQGSPRGYGAAAFGGASAGEASAPAPVAASSAPPAELSPELRQAYENRMSALRTQQGLPEDILTGRAGLASLMQQQLEEQRKEAKQYGDEARAARDAALAQQKRSLTARELFAIAGGVDTGIGEGIGSLSRAAARVLGERETAAEAARKEYGLSQREERAMQANIRQTNILEAQRQQAIREKDYDRANQIQAQIDTLVFEREKFKLERGDVSAKQGLEERKLGVATSEGAADRASRERIAQLQLDARNDPNSKEAAAVARVQAAINSSPMLKSLADKAKFDPNAAAQYAAEEERLYLRLAPELLIGAGTPGAQGSARPSADAILKRTP